MADLEILPPTSGLTLGRALRNWRSLHRVKQAHAGELLGVSQPQILRWESGVQQPAEKQADMPENLLSARLASAADARLARFVRGSVGPVHLVCDFTHKLLAYSEARAQEFRVSRSELEGSSLWGSASIDIVTAESKLESLGWYGKLPPTLMFETGFHSGRLVEIPRARFAWTRFRLSDGSYARLVETLAE